MLEDTIADIVEKLRGGAFPNEQSVSQGIVLRVLSDLHWDVFEPSVVWPGYPTAGGGRADFALCEPRLKPKVLIEVKQPGKADDGVRQSLEYAFHTGVPFVVLTDGGTWSFYLPAEPGAYEDRRVFKLDLQEHSAQRSAAVLEDYLHWKAVASGKALEDARSEHRSRARRAQARQAIPDAWRRLVEQHDALLVELVGDAVESKESVRPEGSDIQQFLARLVEQAPNPSLARPATSLDGLQKATGPATPTKLRPVSSADRKSIHRRKKGMVVVLGKSFPYKNFQEAMIIVLRELANKDANFLSRCDRNSKFRGRKRHYISQSIEKLYPDRADLQEAHVKSLPGGWLVGTNLSDPQKEALIHAAVEVAGLSVGSDVEFRP